MAILSSCSKCGSDFMHNPSDSRIYCENCDGSKELAAKEGDRWASLSINEKLNELKQMIIDVENTVKYYNVRF